MVGGEGGSSDISIQSLPPLGTHEAPILIMFIKKKTSEWNFKSALSENGKIQGEWVPEQIECNIIITLLSLLSTAKNSIFFLLFLGKSKDFHRLSHVDCHHCKYLISQKLFTVLVNVASRQNATVIHIVIIMNVYEKKNFNNVVNWKLPLLHYSLRSLRCGAVIILSSLTS